MRKFAAYYRTSGSTTQKGNASISTQREAVRSYCNALNIEIVKEFTEEKTASGKEVREQFDAAIDLLDSAGLDGLIVYDIDRYFRSTVGGLMVFEEVFKNSGKQLICLRQNIDTSSPEGWLAFGMFLLFAEYELRKINERTMRGRKKVMEEGYFVGGKVPFGYKVERRENRKILVEHPREFQVLQEVKDLRGSGATYREIADRLNKRKERGKDERAKRWTPTDIRDLAMR